MDIANLVQLKTRRASLIADKKRFEQERNNCSNPVQAKDIEKHIAWLDEEIEKVKSQID